MKYLHEKMKELRNREKYTEKEISDKLGITELQYHKYECEHKIVPYNIIFKLSEIYRMPCWYLINDNYDDDYINIYTRLSYAYKEEEKQKYLKPGSWENDEVICY